MDLKDPNEMSPAWGIGCYIILSYVLYWPLLWAMRAGANYHASTHPGFCCDWGEPEFWVLMWVVAPLAILFLILGNIAYWILGPIMLWCARVLW